MNDKDNIFKAIDEGPWLHLKALADIFEEEGNESKNRATRWLIYMKRRPSERDNKFYWSGYITEGMDIEEEMDKDWRKRSPQKIPVDFRLGGWFFKTESEAWSWAIIQVASVMRSCGLSG